MPMVQIEEKDGRWEDVESQENVKSHWREKGWTPGMWVDFCKEQNKDWARGDYDIDPSLYRAPDYYHRVPITDCFPTDVLLRYNQMRVQQGERPFRIPDCEKHDIHSVTGKCMFIPKGHEVTGDKRRERTREDDDK